MPASKLRLCLSPTLLAVLSSGALLTGCDLWGTSPVGNASVASADEPEIVAQMDSVSDAGGSYLFGTSNRTENGENQFLHIIDPDTGMDVEDSPTMVNADSGQIAAQAFTMSADGLSQRNGNNVALFVVGSHRLFKIDMIKSPIVPTPAPQSVQVSSEDHICSLLKVIPKDGSATSSWVLVRAANDAIGNCADTDHLVTKMISSDADTHTAASSVDQISQVLTVQRDTATGQLLAVFGLAPAQVISETSDGTGTSTKIIRKFVRMDGTTGAVSEPTLTPDASLTVTYFGRVAGSTTKAYVNVTKGSTINGLYVLDWSSGTPSLAAAASANLTGNNAIFVHADNSANYYVDGLSLIALTPGGSPKVLYTWPTETDPTKQLLPQAGGVMTGSYLVVPQVDTGGNISLQAISKTKANSARNIVLSQAGGTATIVAHNGDVLIVSETTATSSTLWRVDLSISAIGQKLSDQATLVSVTQGATETLSGERQQAYVIWSTAIGGGTLSLNSHQLASAQSYVLGSGVPAWDLALTSPLTITQGLLTSTTGPTDTLWRFDAGKTNSLTLIP